MQLKFLEPSTNTHKLTTGINILLVARLPPGHMSIYLVYHILVRVRNIICVNRVWKRNEAITSAPTHLRRPVAKQLHDEQGGVGVKPGEASTISFRGPGHRPDGAVGASDNDRNISSSSSIVGIRVADSDCGCTSLSRLLNGGVGQERRLSLQEPLQRQT